MAGRPREFDEQDVLDQVTELFWRKGYEGTSVGDLIDHVSIPRQSLYNIFGSKEELYRRALRHYFETCVGPNRGGLVAADADLQAIETYLDAVACQTTVPGSPRVGCLVVNTIVENEDPDSPAAREAKRFCGRIERALLHALQGAEKAGQLRPGLHLREAAKFLMTAANGMAVMSKAGASRKHQRATASFTLDAIRA
jgi:TetR/AcrR family transcriptional repressor of nem operon